MRPLYRRLLIGVAILAGLLLVLIAAIVLLSSQEMSETYTVSAEEITIPTDEAALARGEYIVRAFAGCTDCHGDNLGGNALIEEGGLLLANVYGTNLTSGEGGIGGDYTDADWVRAIRHGVGRDDQSLIIMPATHYQHLTEYDLGAVIAYIKSVPPVDQQMPENQIGLIFRALMVFSDPPFLPAKLVEHDAPFTELEPSVSAEYGEYLADIACTGCHNENLSGGAMAGASADEPVPANLTQLVNEEGYNEFSLVATLRSGQKFEGGTIDTQYMPWDKFNRLTDDDITALWLFLETLEPRPLGE